ncbi:nucleotidyltransferase domain-containing protein [Fusibacter ferrireducens]|uniref:Nucleotidyltransferase domain-containing protein n=1 Tax=Fusibacter ferrireducens TaxID=2785058 RepID=A0ABS0A092_9FIRM|nr:nucleotidyltransferase domain-containing protein [Fusibacter ferrireducens]MBF4696051.1 nucleotidyltransferase domain-containing protein [Fusibacter ferrireducens]
MTSVIAGTLYENFEQKESEYDMSNNLDKLNVPLSVKTILNDLQMELIETFRSKISAIYIHGSIVTGNFRAKSSDIDYLVLLCDELDEIEIETLKEIHSKLVSKHGHWGKKLEGSYVLRNEVLNENPPVKPRLYYNNMLLRYEAYGLEWIFEQYNLKNYGVAIYESGFKVSFNEISPNTIQETSVKLLMMEWLPKIKNNDYNWTNEYLVYGVLSVCRLIYSIETGSVNSKLDSASYVSSIYDEYAEVIKKASNWNNGDDFEYKEDTRNFIAKVISRYE